MAVNYLPASAMSTRRDQLQTERSRFLPSGSYVITNVRHGVSLSLPRRRDAICGTLKRKCMWKVYNDSDALWYIQGGTSPLFAHRRPAPRTGNAIIASQEQFGWVIGHCHEIQDPDCYVIYAISDHTLLWGLEDGKEQTPVTFCTEETNRENWWRFQRIPDGNDDQIASRADADPPRYVAVVGATVSGISSFVNDAAGSKLDAGDDFNSRSDRVHATQILLDGRPVVLLEISGFGHSSMSDIEPLHSMADYLSRKKIELTGILYMQSISIANVVRSPLRSVAMFRKLCEHIWIVTTDWHDVESRVGRVREQEIMDVFQPLVRARGRMVRHDQAGRSARAILRRVLEKDVIVLRIQAELVDVCKDLPVTSAGAEISSALRRALATGEMGPHPSAELLNDLHAMLGILDDPSGTECIQMVSSAKIYQRLIAYVYAQVKTSLKPHSAKNVHDSMHRALGTWSAWDDHQWLANHHVVRSTLWDVLNQGMSSGHVQYAQYFDLQKLVDADLLAIQSQLLIILSSRERKEAFYGLCSADPVPTLNLLQTILDGGNLSAHDRPRFARTLTRLAKSSACLPDCLMLSGVKKTGRDPVAGGGFADVWTGYFHSTPVALKALRIYKRSDQEKALREFSHEATIWRLLRHTNILMFYGVFKGDENFDRLCLVSPWMDAGNVIGYLEKNPDSDRFALLGDVVNGLAYLHHFQPTIIHGDLKGANIFVTSGLIACLGDFGLSRFRDSQESTIGATTGYMAGTLRWQAPELFESREDGRTNRLSQESDIYSFGCVCLELMTGRPPFMEVRGDGAVMKAITNKQTPQRPAEVFLKYGLDDDLWALMEKCWNYVPGQRPEMGLLQEYFKRRRGSSVHLNGNEKLSHDIHASLDQYGFPNDHVRAVTVIAAERGKRNQKEDVQETHHTTVDASQLAATLNYVLTVNDDHNLVHSYGAVPSECGPSEFQPNPERKQPLSGAATIFRKLRAPEYIATATDNLKEWYLRPTYCRDEILTDQDGGIRGGTLLALIELLTTHEYRDPIFIKTFFLTYKSFTNLNELFDLLVARFNIQAPESLDPYELEEWICVKQTVVRFHVINSFKTIVTNSEEFHKDDFYILERMKDFCVSPDAVKLRASKHLLDLIERAQAGGDSLVQMTAVSSLAPTPPIQPKVSRFLNLQSLEVDALEMARQLTILESRFYNKIRAAECLKRALEPNRVGEHHDHIADVIQVSNMITCWVANTVLQQKDSRRRARTAKHFILIADHCRTLNNFSTMVAIMSCLNSPPIRRLKRTWDHFDSKCMSQLGTCEMNLDSSNNFCNYRSTLAKINPPCIPFIGVYLIDLAIIQNGSKDYLQPDVINFGKLQKTAEVVHEIKHWQSTKFNLTPIPVVLDFIEESLASFHDARDWNEYFWNMSLERESDAIGQENET